MITGIGYKRWLAETKGDDNPFLSAWYALSEEPKMLGLFGIGNPDARIDLVRKYAWAVPCQAALDVLAAYSPLIEIGAGSGYWAWLLRKRGVDVLAFDAFPPPDEQNHYHKGNEAWTKIERGDASVIDQHPDRTLFLCWPPYSDPMAADCLSGYLGERLIFVGECNGGCTADAEFWNSLEESFEEVKTVDIPQFCGIHDYLAVWERKAA